MYRIKEKENFTFFNNGACKNSGLWMYAKQWQKGEGPFKGRWVEYVGSCLG